MKTRFVFIFICIVLNSFSQTYQTGTITLTFNDGLRTGGYGSGGGAGRQIQTEVYYPATTSGSNVALANGTFPVVVFAHGFVMDWSSYDNVYSELSKRGYIVALPRTEGTLSPNHQEFGKDIALIGNKMLQLNITNTLAPIFIGKVEQKWAASGHSMGGGSSFLASDNNTGVSCLFNFAAAQTNPRSSQAAKTVTVPTLIIGGQNDCVAPINTNQKQIWDSTASGIKFNINLKALTHCDFGNGSNFNCTFGQTTSGCANTIANVTALKLYMNFVNPFLDANLKGDCVEASRFMDSVNLSQMVFSKNILGSLICLPTTIKNPDSEKTFIIYPNPTNLKLKIIANRDVQIKLFSIEGKQMDPTIDIDSDGYLMSVIDFPKGIYFIEFTDKKFRLIKKLIIN
jgi:dienelactone hydrolase